MAHRRRKLSSRRPRNDSRIPTTRLLQENFITIGFPSKRAIGSPVAKLQVPT